jgi:cold shock protein
LRRQFAISSFIFRMNTGTVKFFNESKGFGFIVDNASKEEFFVHVTGLIDNIREGDSVTFNVERGKKGMNAVNVKMA